MPDPSTPALRISNFSRYKDSRVYVDAGAPVFGPMLGLREFTTPTGTGGGVTHTIAAYDIGNLDALAVRYYGQGYERLWWVIALANALIDPERELVVGSVILIPARALVDQFLARAGDATVR